MSRWLLKLGILARRKTSIRAGITEAPNLSRATAPAFASTQIVPESSFPRLPPELVSLILTHLWEASQTPRERWAFVYNATLVNRTWLALVAHITSRDVHIHTRKAGMAFTERLSKYPGEVSDLFTVEKMRVTNAVCRSITFHVDGTLPYEYWPPAAIRMRSAIGAFLHSVAAPDDRHWQATLPHLRHIALEYTHWSYDDALGHLEQSPFPPQVTHLSIRHAFPKPRFKQEMCERWLKTRQGAHTRYAPPPCHCRRLQCACGRDMRRGWRYQDMSNVRHLSLSGATAPFAIAVLRSCTGVETLELEVELERERGRGEACEPARLDTIAPLPSATRKVVLRHPGPGAVGAKAIRGWRVCAAVRNGLFPSPRVPNPNAAARRIVVRSGPPDPVAFVSARRECRRMGVELVHESCGS